LERFFQVFPHIAFGLGGAEAEVTRADAVGAQLLGEPEFGDGFAVAAFGPGPIGRAGVQELDEFAAEDFVALVENEGDDDVEEE